MSSRLRENTFSFLFFFTKHLHLRFLIVFASKLSTFFNNFIKKQAVNMMPVTHIQSRVCLVPVLQLT